MTEETVLTTAWRQIREQIRTDAAEYRAAGDTVIEAFADHSAVRRASEETIRFSFTIPNNTVTEIQQHAQPQSLSHTEIRYTDVDRTRFYVLHVHDEPPTVRVLIAGAVDHRSLTDSVDSLTGTQRSARTVLRSATGTVVLNLRHASLDPFLAELGPSDRD